MSESGAELETKGQEIFDRMGLLCCSSLADAPLAKLNPTGAYSKGEHLEVDFLIPVDEVCLVGEITDRAAKKCPDKLKTFQRHINTIDHALKSATSQSARDAIWTLLGVPDRHHLNFRNVNAVRGFAILTKIEQAEIPPQPALPNCVVLYRYHWDLLNEYAETIGRYQSDTRELLGGDADHDLGF